MQQTLQFYHIKTILKCYINPILQVYSITTIQYYNITTIQYYNILLPFLTLSLLEQQEEPEEKEEG